jgi:DNA repair photolyase
MMKKRFGKISSYKDWTNPRLVSNTLELLDKEIPKMKGKIKSVQLCFSTDPFMFGYDEVSTLTIAAIEKLNMAGIKCTVLTKGIIPALLTEMSLDNEYGITLISLNEQYRMRYEPGSAPYMERIQSLRNLHNAGCNTWVSIEPYPTPNIVEQSLFNILETIAFTDRIIFGRTNYSKEASAYQKHKCFYHEQALQVIEFCVNRGIEYYIKKGTMLESSPVANRA